MTTQNHLRKPTKNFRNLHFWKNSLKPDGLDPESDSKAQTGQTELVVPQGCIKVPLDDQWLLALANCQHEGGANPV